MASIDASIEIPAAPADVWAKLTDTSNWDEWLTTHADWPDGAPTLAEGSEHVETIKIMGAPANVNWSVSDFQDGTELTLEGTGPMNAKLRNTWTCGSNGDGTKLGFSAEYSGGALDGPMATPVVKAAEKETNASLENLKGLLGG